MGSPLVLDIGALLAAGRPMSLDERVPVPQLHDLTFPEGAHARLDLRRVGRGIEVTGTIEGEVRGPCGRCLDEVTRPLAVEVDERVDPAGSDDPFAENNVISGTKLDVGDLVRQLAQSALPYGLRCGDECRGLCDRCGRSRNEGGGCDCPPESD